MTLFRTIQHANRPGPPEDSVALRIAACGSVVVAIIACRDQGELNTGFAALSIVLVMVGNVFSYWRRARPLPFLKIVLAVVMISAFAWFFVTVFDKAAAGNLASVEGPLATLFAIMQVAHAFDVPSRRDPGFSLAGSATLMAVAAAQATSASFGVLVIVWAAFLIMGLVARWGSMVGGARVRSATIVTAVLAAVLVAVAFLAVLPAPRAASGLVLPSTIDGSVPADQPSRLVGSGASSEQSASPSGPTGVGGFLGFAGPLNTAVRGSLGNQVVLRVRADRPTFWLAEVYDTWKGQSWSEPVTGPGATSFHQVDVGPPFPVPTQFARGVANVSAPGSTDYQTFYVAAGGSDLILHADRATDVWFPGRKIYVSSNGTIKAGTAPGPGSIYTVLSSVSAPTPAQLESASGTTGLTTRQINEDLQLPRPYPRVAALALRITDGQTTTYGKVMALERWIGAHTTYTTDIPPLRTGQDTVDEFLFGTRRGYCEQISTSLAVMLRSLHIPTQEATGYVPGSYDPLTDLYQVEAKDAHAWVQVWFPGYGWQSFDPTAFVPAANPTPAEAIGHDIATAAKRIPLLSTIPLLVVVIAALLAIRWHRRRPATWRARVTRDLEQASWRTGFVPDRSATLGAMALHIDQVLGKAAPRALDVAIATEEAAWRGSDPDAQTVSALVRHARRIRRAANRYARRRFFRRTPPSDPPTQEPPTPDRAGDLVDAGR